jgi:hypothetical protein
MYNERIKAGVCLNFFSSWGLAECPNVALDELQNLFLMLGHR